MSGVMLRFRLRFTGADGSLGYRTGELYNLRLQSTRDGAVTIVDPRRCPYRTWVSFWRNWEVPD